MELESGMMVEIVPNWMVSVYSVTKDKNLDELLLKIKEVQTKPVKFRLAARRAYLQVIDLNIPGLQIKDLMSEGADDPVLLRIGEKCHSLLTTDGNWVSSDGARSSLGHMLEALNEFVQRAGERLPGTYLERVLFQSVLVAFTDDTDEQEEALVLLRESLREAPVPITSSSSLQEIGEYRKGQIKGLTTELLTLVPEIRQLIYNASEKVVQSASDSEHANAGLTIMTRLSHDLQAVALLTQHGMPQPALTLTSSILELSYLIGYIGKNDSVAKRWMSHGATTPFAKVIDLIKESTKNYLPSLGDQRAAEINEDRYRVYKNLCVHKHPNAQTMFSYYTDFDISNNRLNFTPDPTERPSILHFTLSAIFSAEHLIIRTALPLFIYMNDVHTDQGMTERLNTLIGYLDSVQSRHDEMERELGIADLLEKFKRDHGLE